MNYFWDPVREICVAVDPGSGVIVELVKLAPGTVTASVITPSADVAEVAPAKRHYKKREKFPEAKLFPIKKNKAAVGRYSTKRTVTCKTCGRLGHLAKTCKITETPEAVGERDIDKTVRLTEAEFLEVMEAHNDGMTMDLVRLSYPRIEVAELRRAVGCVDYQEYMRAAE